MKKALALLAVVLTLGLTLPFDAEARRLGGGKSAGMQRQNVTQPNNPPGRTPASPSQAAPAAGAAAAPAAAAAKRSWMGPLAGLAAGLGLAALASHLGFGEAFANMLMIGLLVMAALALFAFFMRKRAAAQQGGLAGAGGMGGMGGMGNVMRQPAQDGNTAFRGVQPAPQRPGGSLIGSRIGSGLGAAPSTEVGSIPADFDKAAFERTARDQFLALQAANDARDLDRLRDYLTPDMFALVSAEIAERGDAVQKTEVFGLQAQVLEVAQDEVQYIVSVRFTGGIREQAGAESEDLDEVWHLVKPLKGFAGWTIAGIQQVE